jgi:DNA repair exonuclease SbcCD ATPase subunit
MRGQRDGAPPASEDAIARLESAVELGKANLERDTVQYAIARDDTRIRARALERQIGLLREIAQTKARLEGARRATAEITARAHLRAIDRARALAPPLAEEMDRNDERELALQRRLCQCRRRSRALEDRWARAREALAAPADDPRADALLAEEAEASARDAAERAAQGDPGRAVPELEALEAETGEIERRNRARAAELAAMRDRLRGSAQGSQRRAAATLPARSRSVAPGPGGREEMSASLDSAAATVEQRHAVLQSLSARVHKLEREGKVEEEQLKSGWSQKMGVIDSLNHELRGNERIVLAIHAVQSEMIDFTGECDELDDELARVRREAADAKRRRMALEADHRELEKSVEVLEQRQAALALRDQELEDRRAALRGLVSEFERAKAQVRTLASEVTEVETKAKQGELTNTVLFEQMHDESAELSVYILELGRPGAGSFLDFG